MALCSPRSRRSGTQSWRRIVTPEKSVILGRSGAGQVWRNVVVGMPTLLTMVAGFLLYIAMDRDGNGTAPVDAARPPAHARRAACLRVRTFEVTGLSPEDVAVTPRQALRAAGLHVHGESWSRVDRSSWLATRSRGGRVVWSARVEAAPITLPPQLSPSRTWAVTSVASTLRCSSLGRP